MKPADARAVPASSLPAHFLNAYAVLDPGNLAWEVRTYLVGRVDGRPPSHEDRGPGKQAIWGLRKIHKDRCRGFGFVIDVDERTVAVPAGWDLPSGVEIDGYRVTSGDVFTASAVDLPRSRTVVAGILRESLKARFKNGRSDELGFLWQDYDKFCQMPRANRGRHLFCRRFGATAKVLKDGLWAVSIRVATATLDSRTLADYYREGRAGELAAMADAKRANRATRRMEPTAVRVWVPTGTPQIPAAEVLELEDPDIFRTHARLPGDRQKALVAGTIRCRKFGGAVSEVPLNAARMILDTQITQEEHSETILEPGERATLTARVRDLLHGADAYGRVLNLGERPLGLDGFETRVFLPPALRVRGPNGEEAVIDRPRDGSEEELRRRTRSRSEHIKRHGFLERRHINPLLACPTMFGQERAQRMKGDLNRILKNQGVEFSFGLFLYDDVEALRRRVEERGHDTLFAVLPDGVRGAPSSDDTHEAIKTRIEVPSQCITAANTLPAVWAGKPYAELKQGDPKLANRVRQRYELCLTNLLVKHHWVPFAPAEGFFYNTHVGLDVGGQHNTHVMACLGHGFRNPISGLIFLPEQIPIGVKQTEPVHPDFLRAGLLALFERVKVEIEAAGGRADFERTVFYRDGRMMGRGDQWNEEDALRALHAEFLSRGWITADSVWTVVEVMKQAEGWRVFANAGGAANPLVGLAVFPFEDDASGLVCTTGRPHLPQGTSDPLKVRIVHLHGSAPRDEVLRDLFWEADMGFTQPEMGLALPWVLHVADKGALQASKAYKISGVTA